MAAVGMSGGIAGVAFIIGYLASADLLAKDVSSPQTSEINIRKRGDTLMKWVHVGQVETAGVIIIAAAIEGGNPRVRNALLFGGALGMLVSELEYLHAKKSGMQNPGPETEDYRENEPDQYTGAS